MKTELKQREATSLTSAPFYYMILLLIKSLYA